MDKAEKSLERFSKNHPVYWKIITTTMDGISFLMKVWLSLAVIRLVHLICQTRGVILWIFF